MDIAIVILAAGKGTRMKSDLPKVMHPLAGWPMVRYVWQAAQALDPRAVAVVVGHGAALVREALGPEVPYVTQAEQLGTGHAVRQAEAAVAGWARTVLVLYGDTPLIRPETLRRLVAHHQAEQAAVTVLSFYPADPTGYGRILRDAEGRMLAVIEEKAATPEQRAIGEANGGVLCVR
ncbi:MAG TPA: bifunctional UDP-N-acetylglucosamine diphosphorylase/glucosamine-1-phosphate N-acetyltransferase GlmU, partial [Anaerolineae bacterium]|nr:bifunctional UDP-N-acetylglucosamine diphosphorylase/glucosamine-1-phosphate N-acetyltransferase GlmU [Anaerolineae bacterium]